MRYIYHYHAQVTDKFKVITIDGIVTALLAVDSMHRYHQIKAAICRDQYIQTENLIITSLSLLHTLEESDATQT